MKLIALPILLWGIGIMASAQNFHYKYYTEKDGLSNRSVTSIIADRQCFLWVATTAGLNSVDTRSKKFRYYNCNGQTDFYSFHLDHADASGNVWMSTYGNGIICFN